MSLPAAVGLAAAVIIAVQVEEAVLQVDLGVAVVLILLRVEVLALSAAALTVFRIALAATLVPVAPEESRRTLAQDPHSGVTIRMALQVRPGNYQDDVPSETTLRSG